MSDVPRIARVEELLSRFPGPLILYPPREKWAMLAAGSLPLVVLGALLIIDESGHTVWGWVAATFFGACLLVGVMRLLPGAASLTLDARGLAERSLFVRRPPARWRDIGGIKADTGPGARADIKSVWCDDASLADTYGLSAEELTELLVGWQQLALAAERDKSGRVDLLI